MPEFTGIDKWISQFGLPVVLLFMVVFGFYRLARFGSERLFDKDNGILQQLVSRHLTFLNEVSDCMKQTTAIQQQVSMEITQAVKDLVAIRIDIDSIKEKLK